MPALLKIWRNHRILLICLCLLLLSLVLFDQLSSIGQKTTTPRIPNRTNQRSKASKGLTVNPQVTPLQPAYKSADTSLEQKLTNLETELRNSELTRRQVLRTVDSRDLSMVQMVVTAPPEAEAKRTLDAIKDIESDADRLGELDKLKLRLYFLRDFVNYSGRASTAGNAENSYKMRFVDVEVRHDLNELLRVTVHSAAAVSWDTDGDGNILQKCKGAQATQEFSEVDASFRFGHLFGVLENSPPP